MVEVQQLRDPLEGEPDCNPYPTTPNPSPLIAGFASFRLSSERYRNRLNRKLKGNGSSVVLEKVSKDKVTKKTKLKTIKQRNVIPRASKGSIAGKVWETFSAVRKTREPSDIIETAIIVGLDRLNVSSCCENLNDSAYYNETDSSYKPDDTDAKEVIAVQNEPVGQQVLRYNSCATAGTHLSIMFDIRIGVVAEAIWGNRHALEWL
ncbi:uncharacterized protein LOC144470885 [Augochlora pura]